MTRSDFSRTLFRATLASVVAAWLTSPAHAQALNVPVKFTYKGTVSVITTVYPGCTSAYTVPAGVTLRITDLYLTNGSSPTTVLPYQWLCSGTSSCEHAMTNYLTAPAGGTMVSNVTTGPRVDAGSSLYLCNGGNGSTYAYWTIYGYLYTSP